MTTPLTNADLDQLDALAEAATPGPWVDSAYDGGWDCVRAVDHHGPVIARLELNEPSNSAFLAAARLAIPALVAEVRRGWALLADSQRAFATATAFAQQKADERLAIPGDALRLARERSGHTMGDLARFLGVDVTLVSAIERGEITRLREYLDEHQVEPVALTPESP